MRPALIALFLFACGSSQPTPADVVEAAARVKEAAEVVRATCAALPRPLSPEAERVCGADPVSEAGAGGQ